ncbi:MAG: hypothetical protein KKA54_11140, partial [Proteobacteria bacterium]|nr:hypothetical protein [Pseudomonadota bacterium]
NMNVSSLMHYRLELGPNAIFSIQSKAAINSTDNRTAAAILRGKTLFGGDITYDKLANMITRGAEIRTTRLTDSFSYQDFKKAQQDEAILLFAMDGKKRLHIVVEEWSVVPKSGWLLIYLG